MRNEKRIRARERDRLRETLSFILGHKNVNTAGATMVGNESCVSYGISPVFSFVFLSSDNRMDDDIIAFTCTTIARSNIYRTVERVIDLFITFILFYVFHLVVVAVAGGEWRSIPHNDIYARSFLYFL